MELRRGLALATAFLAVPVAATLFADAVGYADIKDIREQNAALTVEHHHDWSRATEPARYKMITTTHDPFTAENTYSWLRAVDRASGKELFRTPVPALTQLWISPDSRYIVGISSIKLWNPYQLVVFTRSGKRVFQKDFTGDTTHGIRESVTNAIWWFHENPTIRIEHAEPGGEVRLWIDDPQGKPREFRFPASS
jgi:hypothetical protein